MRKVSLVAIFVFLFLISFNNVALAASSKTLTKVYKEAKAYYQDENYTKALKTYTKGYKLNKKDKRFKEGILKTQKALLNKTFIKQENGKYDSAIKGYQAVLASPQLSQNFTKVAKRNLNRAKKHKTTYQAKNYLKDGKKLLEASENSEALVLFTEGYAFLKDEQLLSGIQQAGDGILKKSIGKHRKGSFKTALSGYQEIKNNKYLSSVLKSRAKTLTSLAQKKKKIYSAKQYVKKANTAKNHYEQLDTYEEAYLVYSTDQRFTNGITASANSLFEYSQKKHRKGSNKTAIKGYTRVLDTPLLSKTFKNEVKRFKKHAEKGMLLYKPNTILSKGQSLIYDSPYEAIELYEDGLYLYPNYQPEQFKEGIRLSAERILAKSKSSHKKGSFKTAIKGYERVIKTKYITERTFAEASINLDLARKKVILQNNGQYFVSFEVTLEEMVMRQYSIKGSPPVRSGRKGEPYWVKATQEEIGYYIDPEKTLARNSIYQFMDLSKISGVSIVDLNKLLKGKGILENTGKAFRDAAVEYKVNEIYLINHALLETGHGTSQLANGVVYNGVTVYNVFGIGAYDTDPVKYGAKRAYEEGWDTIEKAIRRGVKFISQKYIYNSYGQNTLYKMRWNPIQPTVHQYATDIGWAEKQANLMKTYFEGIENPILIFEVPIYKP